VQAGTLKDNTERLSRQLPTITRMDSIINQDTAWLYSRVRRMAVIRGVVTIVVAWCARHDRLQ